MFLTKIKQNKKTHTQDLWVREIYIILYSCQNEAVREIPGTSAPHPNPHRAMQWGPHAYMHMQLIAKTTPKF